ncbi:MAG: hypothetical protein GX041_09805 [Clostridiales bacterium]|nr:hypothetical protein [Clostridiales bacterium]
MRWNAVIKSITHKQAVIELFDDGDDIIIPVKYLPCGCRVGDVIQIDISFSPFDTLNHLLDRINNQAISE